MQSEKIDKITDAIASVMDAVGHVEKSGKVRTKQASYTYASHEDLVIAIRGPMAANGLALVPIGQQVCCDEIPSKYGPKLVHRLTIRWRLLHTSGQWIEVETTGQGWDSLDKALYKAQTGAKKYAIHLIFLLPTVDDPEKAQTAKNQTQAKTSTPKPKPAPKPIEWLDVVRTQSDKWALHEGCVEQAFRSVCGDRDPSTLSVAKIKDGVRKISRGIDGPLLRKYLELEKPLDGVGFDGPSDDVVTPTADAPDEVSVQGRPSEGWRPLLS